LTQQFGVECFGSEAQKQGQGSELSGGDGVIGAAVVFKAVECGVLGAHSDQKTVDVVGAVTGVLSRP
jgi:hypothetical protein